MIKKILLDILIVFAGGSLLLCAFTVLNDYLNYRDLQKRLRKEREDKEDSRAQEDLE